ncbi:hypothetical protein TTHERM_00630350 (macronuclear) [Tetrahymena thermophila SB210]|uniref:Uncharacterized protein n=1 Tax=Tetrahymena thermophila (strain SB210) TaxID=312017 RepID=Q241Q5_TETTS|nr:hypothetical protein TTHERM_00630350 [Tetrahymena thermophila SB210]EAS02515.1 hypothetical protein TTHERM_00630350 [Tetrahymena thermophila SB210]|eukprot:XP_001022760.1 hypothetical protein TTHERM_00630350 [Tetrahymena thermophila SB210]
MRALLIVHKGNCSVKIVSQAKTGLCTQYNLNIHSSRLLLQHQMEPYQALFALELFQDAMCITDSSLLNLNLDPDVLLFLIRCFIKLKSKVTVFHVH